MPKDEVALISIPLPPQMKLNQRVRGQRRQPGNSPRASSRLANKDATTVRRLGPRLPRRTHPLRNFGRFGLMRQTFPEGSGVSAGSLGWARVQAPN